MRESARFKENSAGAVPVRVGCIMPGRDGMMFCRPNIALRRLSRRVARRITERVHGRTTFYRFTNNLVRARRDPGEALHCDAILRAAVIQSAAQGVRLAPEAAVHLPEGRLDRRARRHGEGLRIRQGPVRHLHARRNQGSSKKSARIRSTSRSSCRSSRSTRCTSTRCTIFRPTKAPRNPTRSSSRH